MTYNNVRNYLEEQRLRVRTEWQLYQKFHNDRHLLLENVKDSDLRRMYESQRDKLTEEQKKRALQAEFDSLLTSYKLMNASKRQPFQYYSAEDFKGYPLNRQPAPGLLPVPFKYHTGQTVTITEDIPEEGFSLHPLLDYLVKMKYPEYFQYLEKYCRPLGTTDATFDDFNREQIYSAPVPRYRREKMIKHAIRILALRPYKPIHFVDTSYAKLPLSTGTGYHNRHSFKINAHAKFSAPTEYRSKPTSKGYYVNAFLENARTLVHYIKQNGLPFEVEEEASLEEIASYGFRLKRFYLEYPTLMFTRSHISERFGKLKSRPVYAVDDLFLRIETMLTFPLHIMARNYNSAIMYGLETIRGGLQHIDKLARNFKSYASLDWSQFDQRAPNCLIDIFFITIRRLLIISDGYARTYEYPSYPDLTTPKMATRLNNLVTFMQNWMRQMVFVTADGYAYRRNYAGIPSGMLNTQFLDSFINVLLIVDGMLEYGFSDEDIENFRFFIMGDDNAFFTQLSINELEKFVTWFTTYAKNRYNMTLNKEKSSVTMMRNHISVLSYTSNFGMPIRPIGKLVAQLCYPEHGMKMQYMSSRAIGIAYAACGMDLKFHHFCQDVYNTFLPYSCEFTSEDIENIIKHLPGQYKMLDAYIEVIDLTKFPDFQFIRDLVSTWHGPLEEQPKWDPSHFIDSVYEIPNSYVTLEEYNKGRKFTTNSSD